MMKSIIQHYPNNRSVVISRGRSLPASPGSTPSLLRLQPAADRRSCSFSSYCLLSPQHLGRVSSISGRSLLRFCSAFSFLSLSLWIAAFSPRCWTFMPLSDRSSVSIQQTEPWLPLNHCCSFWSHAVVIFCSGVAGILALSGCWTSWCCWCSTPNQESVSGFCFRTASTGEAELSCFYSQRRGAD